jgi:mono/diheme cytochrome c family protein
MGIRYILVGVLVGVIGVLGFVNPRRSALPNWPGDSELKDSLLDRLPLRLSEYHIFDGPPLDLRPASGFSAYDLSTTLFTDYAEKQRLIKLPPGSQLLMAGDGLPIFPDGTMLVKTFYYYYDQRDFAAGKRLIETRVMLLAHGKWIWGGYCWNTDGTEAFLVNGSSKMKIEWRDENGTIRDIQYVVPSHADCAKCHKQSARSSAELQAVGDEAKFLPLGPTGRNLKPGAAFQPSLPAFRLSLPAWQHSSYTLRQRVGAYLEVNCAHCHNPAGFCARSGLDLRWGGGLTDRRTIGKIIKLMKKGRMPLIGTTVVHEEAVALMATYLQSLPFKH